jgi:hypothetical protein
MTITEFVDALNQKFAAVGSGYMVSPDKPGAKYTRIIMSLNGYCPSVYCFIDAEGNIYKAASWNAPAKGVHATLATVDVSKCDPYSSKLYRR